MNRRLAIGGGVAATALGVIVVFGLGRDSSDVPTFRVEPAPFVRRVTADGTLKAVEATPISAPQEAPGPLKIAWIAPDGALVKAGDVVVRFDPTDFETQLVAGTEDRSTASNKMQKATTQSGVTRKNLRRDASQAQSELDAAKRFKFDDAEVFSRFQRIESDVDATLAGEKKEYAEEVLTVREALARTERDLLLIEDRKAILRVTNAEKGLKALEIIAPHDGILVLQRDWRGEVPRVGVTVWSGNPLGEIPELDAMKAEVFVLEADAAGLAVGQKADVAIQADPDKRFGGKVTQVDKLARPRMRHVPVQYFGVTVTLDKTDPKTMKPGSRVRAVLEVENLAKALVVPRQSVFDDGAKKIVYVRRGGEFKSVEVTLGTSSAGRLVITRGLVEGDEIALRKPEAKDEA